MFKELQVCYISMLFEIKHVSEEREGCSVLGQRLHCKVHVHPGVEGVCVSGKQRANMY
jgi:hypothetical protein